jgi:hypothetical protein
VRKIFSRRPVIGARCCGEGFAGFTEESGEYLQFSWLRSNRATANYVSNFEAIKKFSLLKIFLACINFLKWFRCDVSIHAHNVL